MPQETIGYVELEWTCKSCGARNPGSRKTCGGCGAAMGDQDEFQLPAQQELITDKEKVAAEEKKAPDIHCPYCGARNPAGSTRCTQCAGDLTGGKKREAGKTVGALATGPVPDVPCPYCGTLNPAKATRCQKCGGVLGRPAAPTPTPAPATGMGIPVPLLVALGAILCIVVAVIVGLGGRTTDVTGLVQSVAWERYIEVLALQPVKHEAWVDQIPSDGQKGTCTNKLRRTQDDPAPGAVKVCGTPYVIDQGTGKGKVVQDCQYQIYDSWCEYTRQEWRPLATPLVAQGTDLNPVWPAVRLASGQKEGERTEVYKVIFNVEGKQYTYTAENATDFARFTPGSRWNFKVNAFGDISDLRSAP